MCVADVEFEQLIGVCLLSPTIFLSLSFGNNDLIPMINDYGGGIILLNSLKEI